MGAKRAMILAGSLGLAAAVAGCDMSGGIGKLEVAVSSTLNGANNALARIAPSIPAACGVVAVAQGYFHQLEDRISEQNKAIERKAEAAVAEICNSPPANVGQAFAVLFKAWMAIQNATKTSA